jgi:YegS/Rv2252/BmrU family lipid kinase
VDAVTESLISHEKERKDQEWHAIVNPASGGGRTRKVWPPLAEKLRSSGVRLHQHETAGVGDATEIAQRLVSEGAQEIVVVGGDGTLNEVINGVVADDEVATADVVLSLIPCGTGKDFARTLGIRSPEHALEVLTNGVVRALDVGSISYQNGSAADRRLFINVADVGLGAETAAWMNRSSKRLGGFLGYLVAATRTIIVFSGKPARVLVDDQVVHDGPAGMVVLANGRFFAGGMRIAPNASLTDGLVDVLILDDVPKYTLLGSLLPRVYRGKHLEHPAVHQYRGGRIEISSPESMPFEVDGEQPGYTDIGVMMRQGALKMRTPAPAEKNAAHV